VELEIENLLFQQIKKPKHHLMTKIINVWQNRYRINVYIEIEENNLIKRKIDSSYFCHYEPGKLTIVDGLKKST
jgi:HEPN domain-containing protein